MAVLIDNLPWIGAMVVLIACSAFFSASEAALFYLRWQDRRAMETGNRAQRVAAGLLTDPDRLLSAVLFWNLAVNIAYFAITSIVGLSLERDAQAGPTAAVAFTFGALLAIIFFSEMLPKTLAVLSTRNVASIVGLPLAASIRLVDPLLPLLQLVNLFSRRLIWPRFQPEPYLEISDLERAIELSTPDAQLVEQEQAALRNVVLLSDIRVDEWMRPRTQFRTFRPPVALKDLEGQTLPGDYLLITEADTEEVAGAINLQELCDVPQEHLEYYAEPVVYVPWCARVADALQQMQRRDRQVAAAVNEYGETIGILTLKDILNTLFSYNPSRSGRELDHKAIYPVRDGIWHATGMTSLRRLEREFGVRLPASKSVTVAGVIQESIQRLAEKGDECDWGVFHLRVLEVPERGHLLVELSRRDEDQVE